jgi:hypothetical protein
MHDNELIDEIRDNYNDASTTLQPFWSAADRDLRLFVGDQQDWMRESFPVMGNNMVTFNHIHQSVKWASGSQRQNRMASIVTSTNGGDEKTSSQYSKLLGWQMQNENGYNVISDAFEGAISSRLNFISLWMDYRNDNLNGDIRYDRLSFNQIAFDPWFTKPDMSDCNWMLVRRWIKRDPLISLFPDLDGETQDFMRFNNRYGQDMRFLFMPQASQLNQKDYFAYDEYWRRCYRSEHKVIDREQGQMFDWEFPRSEFKRLKQMMPFAELITVQVPTIERHVLVNGHLVDTVKSIWGLDQYPFIPMFCYFNPDSINPLFRFTSFTTIVADAQMEINRRRNSYLDIIDSQINSGMIVKEGSLVRAQDAFMRDKGKILHVKRDANIDTDIKIIPPPAVPQADYQMQELMASEVRTLLGITENSSGDSTAGNVSGITEMLRQKAAQMGSQGVFDSCNLTQKIMGDRTLDLMQNWSPEKIAKIINEEPTQHFYQDKRDRSYQCIVEQGVLTTTQRQAEFAQLLQLREMGIEVPSDILLEKATIQGKQDLIDRVKQNQEQASQQAQKQTQFEMQKMDAEIKLLDSTAAERYTRGVSNIGLAQERVGRSNENRAQADLDRVRALKEMQAMDAKTLTTLGALIKNMEAKDDRQENVDIQVMAQQAASIAQQGPEQPVQQPQQQSIP